MCFDEFQGVVKERVRQHLPEHMRKIPIDIHPFRRIGRSYVGMSLDMRERCVPIVNLDAYYAMYCRDHHLLGELIAEMAKIMQNIGPGFDTTQLTDYSKVRDSLFIRVCNAEWNEVYLLKVPHLRYEDLAVTAHVVIHNEGSNLVSAVVRQNMLERYGITKEQLFNDAIRNAEILFPPVIHDFNEFNSLFGEDVTEAEHPDSRILSNSAELNGAAALFYEGMMEKIAAQFHSSYYIVPTSIHEMILVKDQDDLNLEDMRNSLIYVNQNASEKEAWLSEYLYYWDNEGKQFRRVLTYSRKAMS